MIDSLTVYQDSNVMDARAIKTTVTAFAAVFVAFFGTVQLWMLMCRPESLLTQKICSKHQLTVNLLAFAVLACATVFLLSRRAVVFRRPIAVLLLLVFTVYASIYAWQTRLWWHAVVAIAILAASIGVALRTRWGAIVTYALTALYVTYWLWAVVRSVQMGFFEANRPLVSALTLVPGIAYMLLAGFCCYASRVPSARGLK